MKLKDLKELPAAFDDYDIVVRVFEVPHKHTELYASFPRDGTNLTTDEQAYVFIDVDMWLRPINLNPMKINP